VHKLKYVNCRKQLHQNWTTTKIQITKIILCLPGTSEQFLTVVHTFIQISNYLKIYVRVTTLSKNQLFWNTLIQDGINVLHKSCKIYIFQQNRCCWLSHNTQQQLLN